MHEPYQSVVFFAFLKLLCTDVKATWTILLWLHAPSIHSPSNDTKIIFKWLRFDRDAVKCAKQPLFMAHRICRVKYQCKLYVGIVLKTSTVKRIWNAQYTIHYFFLFIYRILVPVLLVLPYYMVNKDEYNTKSYRPKD